MRNFYSILFFFLFASQINGFGQIFSSQADFVEETEYRTLERKDSIFVFNLTENDNTSNIGILEIYSPDSVSEFNFSWYRFDSDNLEFNFQQLITTDNSTNYSSISNLNEGGYSVIFTNGTVTDTAYVWIFINDFISKEFRITHKDSEGKLLPARYTCEYVELKAVVEQDTFFYYDEASKRQHTITTVYDYNWSSDPSPDEWEQMPPSGIMSSSGEIRSRTYQPPTEDTHYFLEVTDKYGIKKYDTVFYETIHTKATIDTIPQWVYFYEGEPEEEDYYDDNEKMSAPLTVLFSPKESENADRFVWDFGDGSEDTTYYQPDSVEYTFYYIDPQRELNPYNIVLTTYSVEGCSSADSVEIELENSILEAPPFFSPNGDGNNDRWRVYDVSVRDFELWILNRWGRIVHKFDGADIRDWEGWDGNFKDSNRPAPEGVYYYILKARGWDKNEDNPDKTQRYEKHGFFHLYRDIRR